MAQVCEAIYENGVFRPVEPVGPSLADGQHVRLVVETRTPEEVLRLATAVYDGLSAEDVEDVEQIVLNRSAFFGRPAR